ncbi:zinc-binding alcohol dehydrogenase family protein [Ferrimonas sp. SCSIO 43195]|uniref:zinc-binding alcohol dehydrogenase family protein n=1 Tax=Ferrimonas sp. SCSIO 43195 TaxID=2822844 RepID=UPI0020755A4D|nr:zinc-binding alcohol dehydrogenase family protein [Ferrimonas sp. SCSIO 43195]USD35808.1 zinc-binding alcohol dehydrogenase family protein [Ferrimonas sp. SCSIO 43195]
MKAIGYRQPHPLSSSTQLQSIELPMPGASGDDLLVRVHAISVNPVDTKVRQRAGGVDGLNDGYKILGWDAAGEVVAIGDKVTDFKVGDQVWYAGDLTRPGSNAEYQLVHQELVGRKPANLSFAQAAALPLTTITAWEILFDRLKLDPNADLSQRTLLVIGAAGGVGSILLQLANHLTDIRIVATASRPQTQDWVKRLGADAVIDHRQPLSEALAEAGIDGVTDVVSLTHSEHHWPEIAKLIAPQGQLALIDDAPSLDIMPFKQKSISLHWEFMFTRSLFSTADRVKQQQLLNKVADLVESGAVISTADAHFGSISVANLHRAHTLLESGTAKGKIVLEGFED